MNGQRRSNGASCRMNSFPTKASLTTYTCTITLIVNTSAQSPINPLEHTMTFYELVNVAQAIASRIDVQWGFFITIHMALLGGALFLGNAVPKPGKIVAAILRRVALCIFAISLFTIASRPRDNSKTTVI